MLEAKNEMEVRQGKTDGRAPTVLRRLMVNETVYINPPPGELATAMEIHGLRIQIAPGH
jgi:hypothetical protein